MALGVTGDVQRSALLLEQNRQPGPVDDVVVSLGQELEERVPTDRCQRRLVKLHGDEARLVPLEVEGAENGQVVALDVDREEVDGPVPEPGAIEDVAQGLSAHC
ncbi:MAG TPA: hypothetical protein VK858_06520 [Longimicrobiales bacterium]|nr:hypothetical protein [Longimicrobiales bacterium]